MPKDEPDRRRRRQIRVTGTVQGVGFRPFVYRQATELGLSGSVRNDEGGVVIDVEGETAALRRLLRSLQSEGPPLARVDSVTEIELVPLGAGPGFEILESKRGARAAAAVSVDIATCDDCLRELFDRHDRRYRYPFVNCTNCGPRYTITRRVPYDRESTTMVGFTMCARCQGEYDDPLDRRFHAQPNACPECGPRLAFSPADSTRSSLDALALAEAVALLRRGGIVAVKGLGGYHLAVDAASDHSMRELRRRKSRDDKPFAVMTAGIEDARLLCRLDRTAEEALTSPRRPIVLAPRVGTDLVSELVAPGLDELGVMLAYTPLHHLLLSDFGRPLVMTSGNLSDDPIAYEDDDAVARLTPLVDGFLTHDRAIHVRCDDSVVRSGACGPGSLQLIRRSRGYAPEPLRLPRESAVEVVAVGAELKSTVSVVKGPFLTSSHHLGDLEHLAAYRSFEEATAHLPHLCGIVPERVAHDLHPEYLSTKWALESGIEPVGVQHHHAHVASLLAEHGREEAVLGVAFDGLGWGPDGTLWGGEFLRADLSGYERLGHLRGVLLPGGAAAIREPWRMALSHLYSAGGPEVAMRAGPALDPRHEQLLALLLSGKAPLTSSVGRLFDAVAALLGLRLSTSYEGQAAVELEAAANRGVGGPLPTLSLGRGEECGVAVLDPAPLILAVDECRREGVPRETLAAAFHVSLAEATAALAAELAGRADVRVVALTGGVFQNRLVSELVATRLRRHGLEVLSHSRVPANDAGISVGQAAVAALGERHPDPLS